jgi:hypothetical protein
MARVRLVLVRELETISVYEALAREAETPDAKAFFEHLAKEEKEHVAEATWLLRKLDAHQDAHFQKQYSGEHFRGESAAATPPAIAPPAAAPYIPEEHRLPSDPGRALYALPAAPSPTSGAFTVGALKQRR